MNIKHSCQVLNLERSLINGSALDSRTLHNHSKPAMSPYRGRPVSMVRLSPFDWLRVTFSSMRLFVRNDEEGFVWDCHGIQGMPRNDIIQRVMALLLTYFLMLYVSSCGPSRTNLMVSSGVVEQSEQATISASPLFRHAAQ